MSEYAAHDEWVAVAYEFAIAHRIIHSSRPNAERRSGAHVLKHIAHVRKAQAISSTVRLSFRGVDPTGCVLH